MCDSKEKLLLELYERERARILALRDSAAHTGDYENPVFGEGPVSPELVMIGEAPGGEEAKAGKPFVGKAGKQLDELLSLAKIDRSLVYVTNAVKYRPTNVKLKSVSNRTPTEKEMLAALPTLYEELLLLRPKYVATLGNTPLRAVMQAFMLERSTIGELHGQALECHASDVAFKLFPLYHPASVIYNRELLPTLKNDMELLGRLMREEGVEC